MEFLFTEVITNVRGRQEIIGGSAACHGVLNCPVKTPKHISSIPYRGRGGGRLPIGIYSIVPKGGCMLDTAQAAIRDAARKLGYDEKAIEALLEAEAEHVFEITLKNGKKFPAYRIQHNSKLGPYKGGIRF